MRRPTVFGGLVVCLSLVLSVGPARTADEDAPQQPRDSTAYGKPDKARTYFGQIETDKDDSRYKAIQGMIEKAGK
ncbi:MAG: hypothetical protein A3K19_21295 [Lentisphaerae bacterium RIFOXYB12_FULL_65_16]|nr:MAG: hypothetical protein A3K18_33970 [Lentisphaerae bacterium RIFOXYA12_64_32]OGV93668.1 MAG: hypothetical protein A3K19_21295 [Lentisphaerae bacterium RIFOXYB12_FULL_65_16]